MQNGRAIPQLTVDGQRRLGLFRTHVVVGVTHVQAFVLGHYVDDPQRFVVQYLGPPERHFAALAFPVDVRFGIAAHLALELGRLAGVHRNVFGLGVHERFHCGQK